MRKVYYYPLCPFSRQLRIILKEVDSVFTLIKEEFWLKKKEFITLNPNGKLPVLIETSGLVVYDIFTIIEYLREIEPNFYFICNEPEKNVAIRKLFTWFNDKFYHEVTKIILDEKLIKFLKNYGSPRSDLLKIAKTSQKAHFNFIANLLQSNSYLAGDQVTIADIAAASHISVIDYFNEVIWDYYPSVKNWYVLIKSRPSFKPLLQDYTPGFLPPKYYAELDF
ncbi:glutathione S-transferase [Orientia tsutsugamushi]|uniref:glutathione S-transferase family protein n=1 Tax=Orientia tsutsugamushi TaxID=784 RepID=UPI0005F97CA3|nr:glutathione S-transferase family protein [Orientia tsutsugamushi]KJV70657.1 glutathione S-transferase, C-terminal domain protein [Orientia tsutsugamushi str. TA763]KJV75823.1 glutathione S-transferase, C-terminal domain protein [Orientia tsutsugamushi str. TA763]SPP24165.1 glutathione S-transferase [Orientia tsutsugamushi]